MLVALSGATCIELGIRFLKLLHERKIPVDLIISDVARQIIAIETNENIAEIEKLATRNYQFRDLTAPPASGSTKIDSMVIIPCSMKTLSAIAHGYSDNLITRAADVMIKEKRKLIIVPRESPLSAIHLKNMLRLAKLGVIIFPPSPTCYHHPKTIEELFNHVLGRLLDQLGIETNIKRWDDIHEKLKK